MKPSSRYLFCNGAVIGLTVISYTSNSGIAINKKTCDLLAKKLLKIKYVNLINILQDKEVIPELLQDKCTVEDIYAQVQFLLKNRTQNVQESLEKLGKNGLYSPSEKMAEVLISLALKK